MISSEKFKSLIDKVAIGQTLNTSESVKSFEYMMSGNATPSQMGAFLMGLRVRGETVEELTGGAKAMRARALQVNAPKNAVDTAGTGGDGTGTFNISTAAAILVAASGIPVAKHGNRALTSKSGSADMLSALGVNIEAEVDIIEKCLNKANIGFMMAPKHHGAMRHVGPTRLELGTRTIFNLLGPLSNPANASLQLIGVFDRSWAEPMARVLDNLGSKRVWVVHGSDGIDEITTTGTTDVVEMHNGYIKKFKISPEEAGLEYSSISQLRGGDGEYNARIMKDLLSGQTGPIRDIVILNAAAMILISGRAENLKEGAKIVSENIKNGKAKETLELLIKISNS